MNAKPHPESPRAYADRLGLQVDFSVYMSPAIIGSTGKRHHYPHGQSAGRHEATAILDRLARRVANRLIRGASGMTQS